MALSKLLAHGDKKTEFSFSIFHVLPSYLSASSIIHYQTTVEDLGKEAGGGGGRRSPPLISVEKRRNHSRKKSKAAGQAKQNRPHPSQLAQGLDSTKKSKLDITYDKKGLQNTCSSEFEGTFF